MKLRFRSNSLRLRVNQREVDLFVLGRALREQVAFPGGGKFVYELVASAGVAGAVFQDGTIRVSTPLIQAKEWAASGTSLGIYFELPVDGSILKVAIEKDLECVDGREEERDPDAFPRTAESHCLPMSR